eukprot:TRINITY_DN5551_c0_g1_i2.p1 TRINITY_DN5551_c0_g1~~TRINITY_DN5551_c0_g1_i2.p1  ORF type:complete len:135 (+),score=39.08 TRINITY_DN5551_c0_g1_i2:73-477(+)
MNRAVAVVGLISMAAATSLRAAPKAAVEAPHLEANATVMKITPHKLVEVTVGGFASAAEACDYCAGSYTKAGSDPNPAVNEMCVCMAYQGGDGWEMFCSSAPSATGFIGSKDGGCTCKPRDMEAMGKTTCTPIA